MPPIKGVSDIRRLSRGGKIRLGEKKKNKAGQEYPSKLDYFLFDPDDPALLEPFKALYGETPKRINVVLPSEDREVTFPQYYKLYTAAGLRCKGDGDRANRSGRTFPAEGDGANGTLEEWDCPGPDLCEFALSRGKKDKDGNIRPACKRLASLQVILPDLPGLQTFQIDTTSFHSIVQLNSAFDVVEKIAGGISLIELTLELKPRQVTPSGAKGPVTIFVLNIVPPVSLRNVADLKPLVAYASLKMLPPAEDTAPDDLYPRAQIAGPVPGSDFYVKPPPAGVPGTDTSAAEHLPPGPVTLSLEDDPEVMKRFSEAGYSVPKRKALLTTAEEQDDSRGWLLNHMKVDAQNNPSEPERQAGEQPVLF